MSFLKLEPSNVVNLRTFHAAKHKLHFLPYSNMPIWLIFMIVLRIHLLILVRTLLARSIMGRILGFLKIWYSGVFMCPLSFFLSYLIEYAHNDLIIDVGSFAIYSAILQERIFKFATSICKFCNLDV